MLLKYLQKVNTAWLTSIRRTYKIGKNEKVTMAECILSRRDVRLINVADA